MLGPTATSQVSISFEELTEGTVCRIDVRPGETPTFARWKRGGRSLRELNNSTRLLNTADALEYAQSHWR